MRALASEIVKKCNFDTLKNYYFLFYFNTSLYNTFYMTCSISFITLFKYSSFILSN